VVEIRSPSTAIIDRTTKRHLYEQAGVPWYWLVDPRGPSVTILELVAGHYRESAHLDGDAESTVPEPYPIRVNPAALLDQRID
jgi:Uma2 family endonuclease